MPEIKNITAYGTDGEVALFDALDSVYPMAKQLRCCYHFEKNVLSQSGFSSEARKRQVIVTVRDLLTIPIDDFDDKVEEIHMLWPSVGDYLEKNRSMIKTSLHASNNGGELFYTNCSESINAKLKRHVQHKESSLYTMICKLKTFFANELGSAIDGYTSKHTVYQPSALFRNKFGEFDWNTLSIRKRGQMLKEFNSVSPRDITITDHSCLEAIRTDFDIKPENMKVSVSCDVLKMIFRKADDIIQNEKILPAPSADESKIFSCCSAESTANYHVKIRLGGQVICTCRGYTTHKMCSHTIAAAHYNGTLFDYIRWHRAKYPSRRPVAVGTYTAAANNNRAGLKDNQTRRKRNNTESPQSLSAAKKTKIICPVDHENVSRLCYLVNHPRNSICYQCRSCITSNNANGVSIAEYTYRSYFDKAARKTKISFKKQYVYYHLGCFEKTDKIHICEDINESIQSELNKLGIEYST